MGRRLGIGLPISHDLSQQVAPHWQTRDRMIGLQASQVPKGAVVMLGDSVVEGIWVSEAKAGGQNCAVLNAGFAGIGTDALKEHAMTIIPRVMPRFVVLSVGTNDAWADADIARWGASYEKLVNEILKSGATLVVLTINPPEAGFDNVLKSRATVARFNAAIRDVARRHHLILEDVARDVAGDVQQARARRGALHMTVDGIHPTGAFFSQIKNRWIDPGLEAAEGARHEQCIAAA